MLINRLSTARDQCQAREKLLKLERPLAERFYALYREQFNPDLALADWSSKNGFPWDV